MIATNTNPNDGKSRVSLIKWVGSSRALEQMVDRLSSKLLSDDVLSVFFEGVEVDQFECHQYQLLQLAFADVPLRLPGHVLYKHHRLFATMGLNELHFDRLMIHLRETLTESDIPSAEVEESISRMQPLRQVFLDGTFTFTKLDAKAVSKSTTGEDAVDAAMEEFAWHISEDESLRHVLEGYDVQQLKEHQRKFFRMVLNECPDALGDVQNYLKTKHSHLFPRGLSVRHFDTMACRFLNTLQSLRVEPSVIVKAGEFLRVARDAFETDEERVAHDKASWRTTSWLNACDL